MQKIYKFPLLIIVFFITLFFSTTSAHAADFLFDYDVTYRVNESGKTTVTQDVIITNEQTNLYAQNFTLTVSTEKITNVTARDPSGTITPQVVTSNGQTIISLPFQATVVGAGKKLPFTLQYETSDVAQKKGRIWEIIIPGIEKRTEMNSYTIHLTVPNSFGQAAYVAPPSQIPLTWDLDEFQGLGITLAYGDYQHYRLLLKYQLENTSKKDELQEIALPPDTAYQKVIINRLSELPENVVTDADGNWLARFPVAAGSKKEIQLEGSVLTYAVAQNMYPITIENNEYKAAQKFWEQSAPIVEKSQSLAHPKKIYDFVVSTLTYDYSRVRPGIERLGAENIWNQPSQAVCMEFTDLFVSMNRAAGTASRALHGFAYTTNPRLQPLSLEGDVLHAWAEYYDRDKKLFIPVDPTWGNTTRGVDYFSKWDFNHIVFAILGTSSDYPYPAGAYRTQVNGKNVFVELSDDTITIPTAHIVHQSQTTQLAAGQKSKVVIRLTNDSETAFVTKSPIVQSPMEVHLLTESAITIPPYGYHDVVLEAKPAFSWQKSQQPITLMLNNEPFTTEMTVIPFYHAYILPGAAIFLGIAITAGILGFYGKKRA